MKEKIFEFERKYEAQDELLEHGCLQYLDERTLHNTIKAMLINTTKDCIKYENYMDPDIANMSALYVKKDKTEEDIVKFKHMQENLRCSVHLAKVAERSLYNLLYEMLSTEEIKCAFRQEIPAMWEDLYYMLDEEDNVADNIAFTLSELYECPSYKELCNIINGVINEYVDNIEEYVDDVTERDLYDDFVEARKESRSNNKEQENANE